MPPTFYFMQSPLKSKNINLLNWDNYENKNEKSLYLPQGCPDDYG